MAQLIRQIYVFRANQYVVADEWNANFRLLNESYNRSYNIVQKLTPLLATTTGDHSDIINVILNRPNSFPILGSIQVISPSCEYFMNLPNQANYMLTFNFKQGWSGEFRAWIRIPVNRNNNVFIFNCPGYNMMTIYWAPGISSSNYPAGMYLLSGYSIATTSGTTQQSNLIIKIKKAF